MKIRKRMLLSAVLGAMITITTQAEVVYDNLTTPLGLHIGGFPYEEVADDFSLGEGPRILQSITVAYAGFNFDGDETLTVNLYAMDGPPTAGSFGFSTPGELLFTTTVPIAATVGAEITINEPTGLVGLPDTLAVGLSFGGVDFIPGGNDAGPLLYDPPSTGSSFDDYWLRGFPNPGDPWGLFTFDGDPRSISEYASPPAPIVTGMVCGMIRIIARTRPTRARPTAMATASGTPAMPFPIPSASLKTS
jgi:hypothetical protein